MSHSDQRDVFIHPGGQDDNLGDSVLRLGLLKAVEGGQFRRHVHLDSQSSDYVAGISLNAADRVYRSRAEWLAVALRVERPTLILNAGEINPKAGAFYPSASHTSEIQRVVRRGGVLIAAGLGVKDTAAARTVTFAPVLRRASVISWRDLATRDVAGFGDVAPDWAFGLGSPTESWPSRDARDLICVTLRHDRPFPSDKWCTDVVAIASRLSARIVTLAQVARDAPRAVELASRLRGEYRVPPSMRHDELDQHVRSVFRRSLVIISDRAHALIMGATEGAYPLGSATDPRKIRRLLDTVGLGGLTGDHAGVGSRAEVLLDQLPHLGAAIEKARGDVRHLGECVRRAILSPAT